MLSFFFFILQILIVTDEPKDLYKIYIKKKINNKSSERKKAARLCHFVRNQRRNNMGVIISFRFMNLFCKQVGRDRLDEKQNRKRKFTSL